MNLVEELAKYIFAINCGDQDEMMWEVIAYKPLRYKEAIPFILIFAEWIKGIENPYDKVLKPIYRGQPYEPLNTDYFTFEAARETILSELEKMKNET